MNRAILLILSLIPLLPALAGRAAADRTVGVAPFERSGSGEPPEIATLLADRLLTAGVACVGPDRIGVPAVAEPEPAQVKAWSQASSVDAIVFGRITGIGNRFSVDARLRSARTGEVVSVYVAEIPPSGSVGTAVDELARKVLEGLASLDADTQPAAATASSRTTPTASAAASSTAAASSAAPAPVGARPPAQARPRKQGAKGLFGSGDGAPLRITSDDLEARQSGGARHMIFTDNVKATRGETTLTANRLDAFYPKGSSRPEKLVATGRVVMKNDDGEAHCTTMTYVEAEQRVHCEGEGSQLVRSGDRARGDKIEWDLETDTIFVKGNADVLLIDEGDGTAP